MIRIGTLEDVEVVNIIRKEVNDLHVKNEPSIFKGFSFELQEHVKEYVGNLEEKILLVYENDGEICGYAMLEFITKPENSYIHELKFLKIEELGVSHKHRGRGFGKEIIIKVKEIAKEKGYNQIQLDAWTFNESALKFYLKNGFQTFREYFRMYI